MCMIAMILPNVVFRVVLREHHEIGGLFRHMMDSARLAHCRHLRRANSLP